MSERYGADLLDYLVQQVGCEYISDLRSPHLRGKLHDVLQQLSPAAFPLEQWAEAAGYLSVSLSDAISEAGLHRCLLNATANFKSTAFS